MKAVDLAKKRFLSVQADDSVSVLFGLLKKSNQRAALVFDKKKFLGVSDKHLILKTKFDPAKLKVKKVTKSVPILKGHEDLKELARLFFASDVPILPIMKNRLIIGIVKDIDVIRQLKLDKVLRNIPVSKIMTSKPISILENEKLSKAIGTMRLKHVSRLPIVDKDGDIIMMTTMFDILGFYIMNQGPGERRGRGSLTQKGPRTIRAFRADPSDVRSFPISNFASKIIITSKPSDKVNKIIDEMLQYNINSIILAENKKPVGIITVRDLLKLFLKGLITL